jgi:hypothetical protein
VLTWGIDNVDGIVLLFASGEGWRFPVAKGGRTLDGDTFFSFQFHTIHLGTDRVPTTDLCTLFRRGGISRAHCHDETRTS